MVEYLNTKQVAEFLNLSVFSVRNYAKKGTITATKPNGKNYYFKADEVVKFLNSGNKADNRKANGK